MDLHVIEKRVLALCSFVKKITVIIRDGYPFALIYPDFEALKAAHIVNIENEIRWYAVELYNIEVDEDSKIRGYDIVTTTLCDISDEPNDELYNALKSYIATLSNATVLPSSHIELDLGFDSLNYVELFAFIEQSFGVTIDEIIFSEIMSVQALYDYIKKHQRYFKPYKTEWKEILNEPLDEELSYSPYIMFTYKTLFLPIFKLYFRLEIKREENIPSAPCIIAPSHQSMLDGFLIAAALPYNVLKQSFFLAFEVIFGSPRMRPIANNGQMLLIDVNLNLKHSMQRATLPLKEEKNLVIFPEGARTRDRELLEFRPFFAMLAKEYNVAVVPVVIDGSFEALRAGMLFPRPKKIKITFLEPIHPEGLSYDELTQQVKEAIESEMKRNPLSS